MSAWKKLVLFLLIWIVPVAIVLLITLGGFALLLLDR
jgi:hypothetical protein